MKNIFTTLPIEKFLSSNTQQLESDISRYDEKINSIDIAAEIIRLRNDFGISRPKLNLDKKNYWQEKGEGKNSNVDFVTYKIPFSGNPDVFRISKSIDELGQHSVLLVDRSLEIKLTAWSEIDGNDIAIEAIKKQLKDVLGIIEGNLEKLQMQFDAYNAALPEVIESLLKNQIESLRIKRETYNKLGEI